MKFAPFDELTTKKTRFQGLVLDATDRKVGSMIQGNLLWKLDPLAADGRVFRWDYPERELLSPLKNISRSGYD